MCRQATLSMEDLPDEIVVAAGEKPDSDSVGFFRVREQRVAASEREYLADLLRTSGGDVFAGRPRRLRPERHLLQAPQEARHRSCGVPRRLVRRLKALGVEVVAKSVA